TVQVSAVCFSIFGNHQFLSINDLKYTLLGPSYVFKLTFFLNVRFISHRPIPICGNSLDILSFMVSRTDSPYCSMSLL
ncbi:hypothetical protein L9F63_018486, partial [Diploptera punctata]